MEMLSFWATAMLLLLCLFQAIGASPTSNIKPEQDHQASDPLWRGSRREVSAPKTHCPMSMKSKQFSSTVILTMNKQDASLTKAEKDELGHLFMESFEEANAAFCDSWGRVLKNFNAVGEGNPDAKFYFDADFINFNNVPKISLETSEDVSQVSITVIGECYECQNHPELFGLAKAQEGPCDCKSSNGIPTGMASRPAVAMILQKKLVMTPAYSNILPNKETRRATMTEVQPSCHEALTSQHFQGRILLEIDNSCTATLSNEDKGVIEMWWVDSYNKVASRLCNPLLRLAETATIVAEGASPDNNGITLELVVEGKYRCLDLDTGCEFTDIYDEVVPMARNQRRWLETEDPCACPPDAVANRRPTESEVVTEIRRLSNLEGFPSCSSLEIVECVDVEFESMLTISFADPEVASGALENIETQVLGLLRDFFKPPDPSICYDDFRRFQSVQLVSSGDNLDDRLLEESQRESTVPGNQTNVSNVPTSAPTQVFASEVLASAFLTVRGVCAGCSNELFLGDDVSARRLDTALREDNRNNLRASIEMSRVLQDVGLREDSPDSDCFCPICTCANVTRPTLQNFQKLLQETISLEVVVTETTEALDHDDTSGDDDSTDGDAEMDGCESATSTLNFVRNVTLEVQNSCGSISDLSDLAKSLIANAFVTSYNHIAELTVCDPLGLRLQSATIVDLDLSRMGDSRIPLQFEASAICIAYNIQSTKIYGFPDTSTQDISGGASNPERSLVEIQSLNVPRNLQQINPSCECTNTTLPKRSPLERDVTDAMNLILAELNIPCISNTSECNFGAIFNADMLVQIEVDPNLNAQETSELLKTAYINTLMPLIDGGNSTTCNPIFGVITEVEAYPSFVYNSVGRGSGNDTDASNSRERSLQVDLESGPEIEAGTRPDATNETDATMPPSSSPTSLFENLLGTNASILLQASGVCNGCPSNLFLGDQVTGRRELFEQHNVRSAELVFERMLQWNFNSNSSIDGPESNCYCPVGSIEVHPYDI